MLKNINKTRCIISEVKPVPRKRKNSIKGKFFKIHEYGCFERFNPVRTNNGLHR